MNTLRQAAEDYLVLRRSLGFKLVAEGYLLASFVDYAERAGARRVTTDLALDWAMLPAGKDPIWCAKRMTVVRGFARHLHTIDPGTEVPAADLLPQRTRRATPYLYTDDTSTPTTKWTGSWPPPGPCPRRWSPPPMRR